MPRARRPDPAEARLAAERRFLVALLCGDAPDLAARAARFPADGPAPLAAAGRLLREGVERHVGPVARLAGLDPARVRLLIAQALDRHAARLAELSLAAEIERAERHRRPDAPGALRLVKGDVAEAVAKDPEDPRGRAETRVWIERRPTPLRDAWERGQLGDAELAAGEALEGVAEALFGRSGTRSCLDWAIRGPGESEGEHVSRVRSELSAARAALTPPVWDVVFGVAVLHQPTGERREGYRRWRVLREGLTALARMWRLE